MANRIKGITIELGGDTTGLDKALKSVNSSISKTQTSLNDVNRLLKLDPANTVLVAQKQQLLSKAVSQTEEKLSALEATQEQVVTAFQRGDIGEDKYMAFQREVEATRSTLNAYKSNLSGLQTEQDGLAANTDRLQKLFSATGMEVDDYSNVLGSKLVSAIKNGTANSDQLKTAIEKIGKSATGGKADMEQLTQALDAVDDGQAIQNLIQKLNDAGAAAGDTAEDISQIAGATKGEALMQAADQLSSVGEKIQEIGEKAMDAYSDTKDAVTKVNAYFGETGTAADKSAKVIKTVYEEGVGDSMDGVADAILTVKKNLGDLNDTDLTHITEQAITLEDLYGIDMNETLRGVNSLMEQYGMTAQEAMDYVVKGTQNGLDKTDELGDNLSEYAGKFSQVGYSASDYFQLLNNGLDGGAYNLDKVNDAINEVTTRLADGTIEKGIGAFSTKTRDVFKSWQKGGATQKDVIDSIVSDIGNCTNQQDALNMASLAFGTMGEDGNLKFISSLTSVGSTYDDVRGSAQGLFDQTTTPSQEMESNLRKIQQALIPLGEKLSEFVNTILPPITEAISTIGEWFGKLPGPVQNFVVILGALLAAFTALTPVIAAMAVAVGVLNISLLPIIAIIVAIAAGIAIWIAIFKNWGTITEKTGAIFRTVMDAIGEKIDALKTWFAGLLQKVSAVWYSITNAISGAMTTIRTVISTIWNGIKNTITTVLNTIRNIITTVFHGIKSVITTILNTVKSFITGVWNGIKAVTTTVWNGIKTVILTVVKGIQAGVKVFNAVKSFIAGVWNGIKTVTTTVWGAIKKAIINPIETARDKVKAVIDAIKGFFKFKWSLPALKVPKFSVTPPGWKIGDLLKGVIPHLSVVWHKKAMDNPMLLNSPTIFGAAGNSLLGGGEAGAEVVSGAETLMRMIRSAVSKESAAQTQVLVNILSAITAGDAQVTKAVLADSTFVFERREFARAVKSVV